MKLENQSETTANIQLNAPELVEANIAEVTSITIEKFLGSFTSVTRLLLNLSPLKNFHKDGLVSGKWNEPKDVPECLLSQLETFVWRRLDWGREEEKEIATYILKNGRRLKKETFTTNPIESEGLNKLKERLKVLNGLDGVQAPLFRKDGVVVGKWNQPKNVPQCLLSHLETFVWTRYRWEREEEKEEATYILKNARLLSKATFSTNIIDLKEFHWFKK
ncbi:putative protein [Arabidopsis thaliana]|uniref:F-box/FBD/LRR protein n=1 Tax=Arabidopsis thaliana TaxID=3702 RepID=Q9M055_ARATH|nr:F-box/FBD/LRR protein [Arabidopsis thaliana]AEE79419.1 F-box/FBD/LRR protein [Arabidopsis thaliana]CAB81592.1 putative protein [Arabidopsis thaliana]|eukprot:NP_191126.1 F-box/FBD/LRR protein [Arabidopsis thaliana]